MVTFQFNTYIPAVGNGHHYIPVETDAFEIVLRVFADEPVKHGVEVDAQFSAVCGILYQFFNLLVKLPLFQMQCAAYLMAGHGDRFSPQ
ncbi:hypothetical protein [Phocaeicola coprophilus]|uniref:hypothetical protein n=1 Tax=Phocaeicola coprophilus TaxID=387090 RepID=UPI0039948479